MNSGGMSQGQTIAAVSALVLVVSLFLAWVGIDIPEGTPIPEGVDDSVNGWKSQSTLDLYLAIVAALVLGGALMTISDNPEGLPFAPTGADFLLGAIGTILTVYFIFDGLPESAEIKIGAYLAAAACIGITIGSYLQMREEAVAEY